MRNALQSGEWGNEEKEGKMPFEKGVGADIKVKNEEYAFQVGTEFVKYLETKILIYSLTIAFVEFIQNG